MKGLLFLFGCFLASGLFFLTASFLHLPTIGAAKAMLGTVKQDRKAAKSIETYLMTIAVQIMSRKQEKQEMDKFMFQDLDG